MIMEEKIVYYIEADNNRKSVTDRCSLGKIGVRAYEDRMYVFYFFVRLDAIQRRQLDFVQISLQARVSLST